MNNKKILIQKIYIVLLWIAIWQLASMVIHNIILLAGPAEVLLSLIHMVGTAEFWQSAAGSCIRIAAGFTGAFLTGMILGSLSYRFSLVKMFLQPAIQVMKAIPVASFVILALIWAGSSHLSVLISFLVVFPVIYVNTLAGLESTDPRLLEMAEVFQIPMAGRIRCIYLPAVIPYLISGCEVALGMSWKSGVAAEVIGIPEHSIGERLYMAKLYLETADVLAWTIMIIVISSAFEKAILWLIRRGGRQ